MQVATFLTKFGIKDVTTGDKKFLFGCGVLLWTRFEKILWNDALVL